MNRLTADIPDLKRNLQRLVRAALGEGMKSWFKDVEKRLFNLTEQATDDESRQAYFDAVASIKRDRQAFEESLLSSLETDDLAKKVPHAWSDLIKDRNLSLEVEDAVSHARARFGIEHAQYEARIAWMNQQDAEHVPEGMYTLPCLTTAVIESMASFPPAAQDTLLRAMGSQLLNRLEPLYVLLNDYLIQAGILARIRSIRTGKDNPAGSGDRTMHEILSSMDVMEPTVLSGAELHAAIYRLADKGKHTAIVDRIDGWHPELIQEVIQAHLRRQGEDTRINPEELQSIKLVGLLFSGIMNDPKVRLPVRQKILSLQWPVLSIALRERGFFRHASHPARDVPNLCALIGSDPNASQATLIELGAIIDRVVLNHENNVKAFTQARDELKALEQHGSGLAPNVDEKEAISEAESSTHDDMLQRCQHRVRETIHTRIAEHALSGSSIKAETSAFINNIIDPAMVTAMINYGRNSQPWIRAEESLDAALELQSAHDIEFDREISFSQQVWEMLELVDQGTPQMQQHLNAFIDSLDWHVLPLEIPEPAPAAAKSAPVEVPGNIPGEIADEETLEQPSSTDIDTTTESLAENPEPSVTAIESEETVAAAATADVALEIPPETATEATEVDTEALVEPEDATASVEQPEESVVEDVGPALVASESENTGVEPTAIEVSETTDLSTNDNSEAAIESAALDQTEGPVEDEVGPAVSEDAQIEAAVEDEAAVEETEHTEEQIQAEQDRADARIVQNPAVLRFVKTHLMNNEWFQVYTGSGSALRRLKGKDVNPTLGVVNFANRTGELELFLPLTQLVHDLLEERTRPVFENPTYNRALRELKGLLDSETAHDD